MTKQDIINKCLSNIEEIKNDNNDFSREFNFYVDFVSNYSPFTIDVLNTISYSDFFKAMINIVFDGIAFEIIDDEVDQFSFIFDSMKELNILSEALSAISKASIDDDVIEILKDNNKYRSDKALREILSEHGIEMKEFNLLLSNVKKSSLIPLFKYNKRESEIVNAFLILIMDMKMMKLNLSVISDELFEIKKSSKMSEKNFVRKINKMHKEGFHLDEIRNCFSHISNYYKEFSVFSTKYEKAKNKEIRDYNEFIDTINKVFSNDEVVNYENIIKKIPDEEIRLTFLKLVYQHNKLLYENLNSTYQELSKNSTVHFLTLLKQYSISKDEINLNMIMKNNYETFSYLLALITSIVDDKVTIINALQVSDTKTCIYLKELKDKGILSSSTFVRYPMIFDKNSSLYNNLINNIEILSKYKLNPSMFINNPNVILNDKLESSLIILKEYNLLKSIKSSSDYSYLSVSNLASLIDKIIELGFEKYLVEDLSLLNEGNWDRIYLLKAMNYEIESKEELLFYLRNSKFIVPDNEIDDYIPNIVDYYDFNNKEFDMSLLNEYDCGRSYNINGVILSKNRVLRNINNNNSDFKSLFLGGIYNIEDIDNLSSRVMKKKK